MPGTLLFTLVFLSASIILLIEPERVSAQPPFTSRNPARTGQRSARAKSAGAIALAPTDPTLLSMASLEFHGALLRGNRERLSVLLAPDFAGTMPDESVWNRSRLLATTPDSRQYYKTIALPPNVTCNIATVTNTISLINKAVGPPEVLLELEFHDTWRKQGKKWLLVATVIAKR